MRTAARRWTFRTAVIFALLALLSFLTAGTAVADISGVPEPITDEADDIKELYIIVLVMALVVFVAVEGALLYIIFRYRRRDGDAMPPQTHGNNVLEVVWTTIPIVIVLILFVFSFITLVEIEDDAEDEALTIQVTGFRFQWQFEYALNDLGTNTDPAAEGSVGVLGTAAEEPQLVIPVDEPVEFVLNSPDVIHSFYVRNFLYKLDVIPGRENTFSVTAHETGTFEGQCAELCGENHALMRFSLRVVTREEFDAFIAGLVEENEASAARVP